MESHVKSKYLDFLESSSVPSTIDLTSPTESINKFKRRTSVVLKVESRPESEVKSPPSKIKRLEPDNSTTLANKLKQFLAAAPVSKLALM